MKTNLRVFQRSVLSDTNEICLGDDPDVSNSSTEPDEQRSIVNVLERAAKERKGAAKGKIAVVLGDFPELVTVNGNGAEKVKHLLELLGFKVNKNCTKNTSECMSI